MGNLKPFLQGVLTSALVFGIGFTIYKVFLHQTDPVDRLEETLRKHRETMEEINTRIKDTYADVDSIHSGPESTLGPDHSESESAFREGPNDTDDRYIYELKKEASLIASQINLLAESSPESDSEIIALMDSVMKDGKIGIMHYIHRGIDQSSYIPQTVYDEMLYHEIRDFRFEALKVSLDRKFEERDIEGIIRLAKRLEGDPDETSEATLRNLPRYHVILPGGPDFIQSLAEQSKAAGVHSIIFGN